MELIGAIVGRWSGSDEIGSLTSIASAIRGAVLPFPSLCAGFPVGHKFGRWSTRGISTALAQSSTLLLELLDPGSRKLVDDL